MDFIESKKQQMKQQIKSGTVVTVQGEICRSFIILHSGMVEVLHNPAEGGSSREELIDGSRRIGLIKGEAMIGIVGIVDSEDHYALSLRCVSDCRISVRPVGKMDLLSQMQKEMGFNFKVIRDLSGRVESSLYLYTNYKYLWHKYASIADSLALGTPGKPGSVFDEKNRTDGDLEDYGAYLKAEIKELSSSLIPETWDYNIFLGHIQDRLGLYDDHDRQMAENLIDHKQFLFIKRLIHKDDKILSALLSKDEPANQYIITFLNRCLEQIIKANIRISGEILELMDMIYSDEGWAARLIGSYGSKDPNAANFLHFLAKFSWRCRKDTMTLLGMDLFQRYRVFGALKRYQNFTESGDDPQKERERTVLSEQEKKQLAKYKGLLNRILQFSDKDDPFKQKFVSLMDSFVALDDKMGPDGEKLREEISSLYWELYESCFLKVIDSDLKGFIPGIMLHFGVIDERLLNQKDLLAIDRFYAGNLYSDESIPVMTLPYFLEKVYKSEVAPSMTEMGDMFATVLKSQTKLTKKEKAGTYLYEDTAEDRVRFEIRQIARELYKMLFGNKIKALPFLCGDEGSGSLHRFFVDLEEFGSLVDSYRQRDFSLFYREVMIKHQLGSDFIMKEVVPNFVFYPIFGSRSVMWQEMEGTRKDKPGRIFFPLHFSGKLPETTLVQLAYFRWELQKSIAGYNWTDPVEGGLVGAYYDYIRFYKKNPNITSEAKERLTEFIKKTKSDKDRFSQDYISWIVFEYEGKIRMNSYVRDMFYRHCPFPAEKREEMGQKTVFQSMENKFQNRRQKEILKLKSKTLKFEKKKKALPEEIRQYMEFLSR